MTARRLRDEGGPPLRIQALVYPVCDAALNTPSYREKGDGLRADRREHEALLGALPRRRRRRAARRVAAARGRPGGLPPAFILTRPDDVLCDEAEAYAAALEAAGVPVELRRYDGAIHGFFRWIAKAEIARRAVAEVGDGARARRCARGLRMRHVAAPTAADLADAAAVVGERLAPTPLVPAPGAGRGRAPQARDAPAHGLVQGPRRAGRALARRPARW